MKKIISIMLVAMMLVAGVSTVLGEDTISEIKITFSDVTSETQGAQAIEKLVKAGIINGYEDGTFKPTGTLTRAELTKIINLAFGYTEPAEENFWDVKSDDWFYDYALIAKKAGYIVGFEDGSFGGNQTLTKEQVCMVISRCAGLMLLEDQVVMPSDKVSDWAKDAVAKVLSNQFMSLGENDTFKATEKITRAELVQTVAYFVSDEAVVPTPTATPTNTSGYFYGGSGNSSNNSNDNDKDEDESTPVPTTIPSEIPSESPSESPSETTTPTVSPDVSEEPSESVTPEDSSSPSNSPNTTANPTASPTIEPTATPAPTEEPIDYTEKNKTVVDKLKQTKIEIWNANFMANYEGCETVMEWLRKGINKAIDNQSIMLLTNETVKKLCADEIKYAKEEYKKLSEDLQGVVITNLLDVSTADFLLEYFDIDF